MQCPVCKNEMIEEDFEGVQVDVCRTGCRGLWFDWMELRRLDENNEGMSAALEEALNSPRISDEGRGKIDCPKCGIPMYSHRFKKSKEVNVDECVNCGGFFLDSGELRVVRETHMSDEEHQEYLERLAKDVPGYEEEMADAERKKLRKDAIGKFAGLMRFGFFESR